MVTATDIETAKTKKILEEYATELEIPNARNTPKDELVKKLLAAVKTEKSTPGEIDLAKETPKAFFERVKAISDLGLVEQECRKLADHLGLDRLEAKSKANKLQPYRKLFKSLTPTSETLHLFFEYRATASQSPIMRHVFDKFTGLSEINWDEYNQEVQERKRSKDTDQLAIALNEENKVFSLEKYLKTVRTLLNSSDCWELACGLIAASGRRPSEILMFGNFQLVDKAPEYIPHPGYAIKVDGLAKKRDQNPVTIVPLLIPAIEFMQALTTFRAMPELKKYRESFDKLLELGYDKSDSWDKIEDSVGNKVRAVTDEYFSFLPKIEDGQNRKNILLRACTTKLIVMRDYPKASNKAKIQYAGVIDGHIIPKFKEDGSIGYDGQTNASTLNYDDYEPDTNVVPLLANIVKIKEVIKETEDMVRIAELETVVQHLKSELAAKDEIIANLTNQLNTLTTKEKRSEPLPDAKEMSNKMLFSTRKSGTAIEKIERGVNAIRNYNDSVTEKRIAITNQAVRELTGVNGLQIRDWMNNHYDEILSHHAKYEMTVSDKSQPEKMKTNEYYNKRYGAVEVAKILELIKENYLYAEV